MKREVLSLIGELKKHLGELRPRYVFASKEDSLYFSCLSVPEKAAPCPVRVETIAPVKPHVAPLPPKAEVKALPEPVVVAKQAPLPKEEGISLAGVRSVLMKCCPQMVILDKVPGDGKAKILAERWKTKNQAAPISVLSLHEPKEHKQFLVNLTTALEVRYGGAKILEAKAIESQATWETFLSATELKWILISDATLWQMPNLLKFYRELPNRSKRFLLNTPVLLLPDLSLYLKDPLLKRSLWKTICQSAL